MDLARIEDAVHAAREWDAKGDPLWAGRGYAIALLGTLGLSLREYGNVEQAVEALRVWQAPQLLAVYLQRYSVAWELIRSGQVPGSALGGSYEFLVMAHLAALLGERAIAAALVEYAAKSEVVVISTKFWAEYSRAMTCLHTRQPYTPALPPRLRGQEKYWAVYLDLIADITQERDLAGTLGRVSETFQRRNRDKRIHEHGEEIEGSGWAPVRWDFRRAGILQEGVDLYGLASPQEATFS